MITKIRSTFEYTITESACPAVLGVGASCVIEVSFAPEFPAEDLGKLVVEYPGGTVESQLVGEGVAGALEISPGEWNFGEVKEGGKSLPTTFVVTNASASTKTLTEPSIDGANDFLFLGSGTCEGSLELAPSATCTVKVVFEPESVGKEVAEVRVASADPSTKIATAALVGIGI